MRLELLPIFVAAVLVAQWMLLAVQPVSAICCGNGGCLYCEDCTETTPCCATGSCNIFCCNCDGECRTGELCPIGAVGRLGQRVEAGPNCNLPFDRLQPYCAVKYPGDWAWTWVHACTTRGRRRRSVDGAGVAPRYEFGHSTGADVVRLADLDHDGHMNASEAMEFLIRKGINVEKVRAAVLELDANGNGSLSAQEIDPDSA